MTRSESTTPEKGVRLKVGTREWFDMAIKMASLLPPDQAFNAVSWLEKVAPPKVAQPPANSSTPC